MILFYVDCLLDQIPNNICELLTLLNFKNVLSILEQKLPYWIANISFYSDFFVHKLLLPNNMGIYPFNFFDVTSKLNYFRLEITEFQTQHFKSLIMKTLKGQRH